MASPQSFAAIEDRLSDALARYDTAALGDLWDDNFVFVFPNGHVENKSERLAAIKPPAADQTPTLTNTNDSVAVAYEDANLAIVLVRSSWRTKPTDKGDPYIATHVWIRRGDRWRLVSAQVAHVGR